MKKKEYSRRDFIRHNSITGLGLFAGMSVSSFLVNRNAFAQPKEPIIDIHQHTNYVGRSNDELLAHQRAMGVSLTVLQPAGRPLDYGSTYYGVGNGLQAEATGNEACYAFAKQYPKEFMFGANEVPDFPGAVSEIEKYLKLGAPVLGESKFGVECDSPNAETVRARREI